MIRVEILTRLGTCMIGSGGGGGGGGGGATICVGGTTATCGGCAAAVVLEFPVDENEKYSSTNLFKHLRKAWYYKFILAICNLSNKL